MASSPLILDRYRVVGQAGAGGYGTVVHAFDTHLKRDVAIKCIELSEDEVARARLVALEARMAADLEGGQGAAAAAGREFGRRRPCSQRCRPGGSVVPFRPRLPARSGRAARRRGVPAQRADGGR